MPPRKSNVSQSNAPGEDGTPVKEREGVNIEDLSLPRTMVQRLAKGVLPPNTSLHKDAILALSKSATVFINYLAHAANTASLSTGKRSIPPQAVIDALAELEFESFGPRVEAELKRFNEVQTGKRNEYRRKVREGKMASRENGDEGGDEGDGDGDEGEGRASKRVRRDEAGDEGERERRESGSGSGKGDPSDQLQGGYRVFGDEEPVDDDDDEDEEDAVNGDGRANGANGVEEEEEEEEEEEKEEDDDDEDEYPDEGRRLSSVEREANAGFDGDDPGTLSGSEAGSEDDDDDDDDGGSD